MFDRPWVVVQTVISLAAACVTPLWAQSPAEITTTGQGEIAIAPDRAVLRFDIESLDSTASRVATANARTVTAVTRALAGLGFPRDSVPTVSYSVFPDCRYTSDGRKCDGYRAHTTIQVSLRDFARIAPVIDAALGAGATSVSSVAFEATNTHRVRQEALTMAVDRARTDATTLARAAGGQLGRLVSLSTQDAGAPVPMMRMAVAQEQGMQFTPQDVIVQVTVVARWQLAN